MDKIRGQNLKMERAEQYPKNFIEQYLRASTKLRKIERVVFKRFAPSVADVKQDFYRLALNFEECGIYQYAAMCHIGQAKCEQYVGVAQDEANAYLRGARAFMHAHVDNLKLRLRSVRDEFRQGALHCYHNALERTTDASVIKAAIIREINMVQPEHQLQRTSMFSSPTHRINDLEIGAETSIRREDFICALRQYDDIVDNIYERKMSDIYGELLHSVEILRILLLIQLNVPPVRQSPAHIKLIEYYYELANFENVDDEDDNVDDNDNNIETIGGDGDNNGNKICTITIIGGDNNKKTAKPVTVSASAAAAAASAADSEGGGQVKKMQLISLSSSIPGSFIPMQQQYALADIVFAWVERRMCDLRYLLKDFAAEFTSISNTERHLLKHIYAELCKLYH